MQHDGSFSDLENGTHPVKKSLRYILRPYYRLMPGFFIFAEFEHEQAYGRLKKIRKTLKESTIENTLTFGFSILF